MCKRVNQTINDFLGALVEMLHFNRTRSVSVLDYDEVDESVWKILVLDQTASKIISPVMKLSDLRDEGVTLYPQLHSPRQPVEDVPAIYFVEPTGENVDRILADLQTELYARIYLNWTTSIPRPLMEKLAEGVVRTGASHVITKVKGRI